MPAQVLKPIINLIIEHRDIMSDVLNVFHTDEAVANVVEWYLGGRKPNPNRGVTFGEYVFELVNRKEKGGRYILDLYTAHNCGLKTYKSSIQRARVCNTFEALRLKMLEKYPNILND